MNACIAPVDDSALFENAFNHAPIGMAMVAPDRRILRANTALGELLGYDPAELCSMSFVDITHPDDLEVSGRNIRALYENPGVDYFRLEKRYFHRNGHLIWVLLSASLIRDSHGTPLYMISQIQDITVRKEAEAAQEAERVRLETLISNLPEAVLLEDEHRQILQTNRYLCELLDLPLSPEDIRGMDCKDLAEDAKHQFGRPEFFVGRINEIVRNRRRVLGEMVEMADGRMLRRDYIPVWRGPCFYGHLWRMRPADKPGKK